MRILLIEDEKEIVDFLKPFLESACFSVDVAEDGEQGSFLARTTNYDLVILDNVLPKKQGSQVCSEIRKSKKDTPILMISVIDSTSKKVELLNTGADDYLTKPFSLPELLARVQALLRRPKEMLDDIVKISDLVLDNHRNTVTRGNKEIALTKKEFMLLRYLIRNKGMVLSRSMILEHVWDRNSDLFSNTIESHILNLRKKIEVGNKMKLIHTISGRGYKIEE